MNDQTGSPPIGAAAARSLQALDQTSVHLDRVCRAQEICDAIGPTHFLHAGPPLDHAQLPGPMRGAIIGGLLFEGAAGDPAEAARMIDAGAIDLTPCHHVGALGAMAGIITPKMPVVVARSGETFTFSALNEGIGGAVRYGSFDRATLDRLEWMAEVMVPVLGSAVALSDPIDLTDLVAEGLRRGDECHNRLVATTSALIAKLAPVLFRTEVSRADAAETLAAIADNGHFALPFAIAAAKALTLAASDVADSPIVTAMAANGIDFGIRVSGTGDRWFTAPSPVGDPMLIPGASMDDVNPTMGDSMIAETAGFGAFAMSAAPAIMAFVGGTAADALAVVAEMRSVCAGESSRFLLPGEDYRGTPIGIDVHRVRETGIAPVINNGLAHREPGKGRIGAGITRVPIEPFVAASEALTAARR